MIGACEAVALGGRDAAAAACYEAALQSTAMWLAGSFLLAMAIVVGVGVWRKK